MSDPEQPDDETKKKQPLGADQVDPPEAKASSDDEASDADADAGEELEAQAEAETDAETAARDERRRKRREARERDSRKPSGISPSLAGVFAVLALAAGGAAGWFGHVAHAKQRLRADSAPAASGSGAAAGPCVTWQKKLCQSGGEESALCQQARAASEILVPSTCEVALEAVPATLAKVKLERAPCEQLVNKLCADLPPGSGACTMVKEKTPAFPPSRCSEMLKTYAEVLDGVKQIDKQLAGKAPSRLTVPPGAGQPPGAPHP